MYIDRPKCDGLVLTKESRKGKGSQEMINLINWPAGPTTGGPYVYFVYVENYQGKLSLTESKARIAYGNQVIEMKVPEDVPPMMK